MQGTYTALYNEQQYIHYVIILFSISTFPDRINVLQDVIKIEVS